MRSLFCPYLGADVELPDERARHILARRPEFGAQLESFLAEVLRSPESVRRSQRFPNARLFTREYHGALHGKHCVVVVVSDAGPPERHWVITAYITRKLAAGNLEWPTN